MPMHFLWCGLAGCVRVRNVMCKVNVNCGCCAVAQSQYSVTRQCHIFEHQSQIQAKIPSPNKIASFTKKNRRRPLLCVWVSEFMEL